MEDASGCTHLHRILLICGTSTSFMHLTNQCWSETIHIVSWSCQGRWVEEGPVLKNSFKHNFEELVRNTLPETPSRIRLKLFFISLCGLFTSAVESLPWNIFVLHVSVLSKSTFTNTSIHETNWVRNARSMIRQNNDNTHPPDSLIIQHPNHVRSHVGPTSNSPHKGLQCNCVCYGFLRFRFGYHLGFALKLLPNPLRSRSASKWASPSSWLSNSLRSHSWSMQSWLRIDLQADFNVTPIWQFLFDITPSAFSILLRLHGQLNFLIHVDIYDRIFELKPMPLLN